MVHRGVKTDGDACRLRRVECGYTQEDLAEEAGLSKASIERVERGNSVSVTTLNLVAKALETSVDQLLPKTSETNQTVQEKTPTKRANKKKAFRIRSGAPGVGPTLVGRTDDLAEIRNKLEESLNEQNAGVVVVQGVGGIGKSSIVNHFAYDQSLADLFPDGCFWAGVGNSPDVLNLLIPWTRSAKISSGNLLRANDVIAALRAKLHGRKVLLLVDDLWNSAHAESFRVAGPGAAILYTTRLPKLANQLALNTSLIHSLSGLETNEGLTLLAQFAPDVVEKHRRLCTQLIESVEGLPLAISVAGRLLHREHLAGEKVNKVIANIRDDAKQLLNESAPVDMADLLNQTTPEVAAVLRRSLTVLTEDELFLFAQFGMFPEAPVRWNSEGASMSWKVPLKETKQILKRFAEYGLIEKSSPGFFRIHPLMKALAMQELVKFDVPE